MTLRDVRPQHRVIYGDRRLEIVSVQPSPIPIPAGQLRHWVHLQSDVLTRTKGVESKVATNYVENVPAKVEALSGSEFWRAQQVNSQINWRVTLRLDVDGMRTNVLMCREMNG